MPSLVFESEVGSLSLIETWSEVQFLASLQILRIRNARNAVTPPVSKSILERSKIMLSTLRDTMTASNKLNESDVNSLEVRPMSLRASSRTKMAVQTRLMVSVVLLLADKFLGFRSFLSCSRYGSILKPKTSVENREREFKGLVLLI